MGVGDKKVILKTDHGDQCLWLRDVYHVPQLQFNLFSVRQQVNEQGDNHVAVHIDTPKYMTVLCQRGKARAITDGISKLYKLRLHTVRARAPKETCIAATESARVDMRIWHRRSCHPGKNVFEAALRLAMKQLGLTGVKAPERKECVPCIKSKLTRKPFKKHVSKQRQWQVGEKAHSDIWGPYAVPSYSGCRYFCILVDEASRFVNLFVLKERSELYEIFIQYYKNVKVQKGVKMKSLNMDNAKEYLALKKLCETQLGMECTLTIKKKPEHNGIAERMNRTLAERIRCVLFEGNLPTQLWRRQH
jgi:hypothetical protein